MTWSLISWQSIIAGTVAALAVSIVMAVLGVALGFTVIQPSSDNPFSGLGMAFGIWGVISVVVSLAVGGFVAGMFAGVRGCEHGFMVWALVLIAATMFSGMAVGMAVRTVGSAVKGVGSGAASVASSVGHGISSLASTVVDQIQEDVNFDFDTGEFKEEVTSVLRDTGAEKLQPEYLKGQMREARSELRSALNKLRLNADDYEQVIADFLNKQKTRLDSITGDIDKDAAVNAIMKKRGIDRAEAEQEVDNAIGVYHKAVDKAEQAITDAQQQLHETKEHIKQMADKARAKADAMASSAAKSALAAALALILGAILCMYAGYYGIRYSGRDGGTILIQETKGVEIQNPRQ